MICCVAGAMRGNQYGSFNSYQPRESLNRQIPAQRRQVMNLPNRSIVIDMAEMVWFAHQTVTFNSNCRYDA
jgi:hypothetical protein